MYVKLYNQILDSSIADNRKLRHFFIDLLLCSDPDGNVIMTNKAISLKIRAPIEEVEWGLRELQKKDESSLTPENDGRRIVKLDGHGYGWKIVNYELYRDFKTSKQLRESTAKRVREWRKSHTKHTKPTAHELKYLKIEKEQGREAADAWLDINPPTPVANNDSLG